MIEVQLSGQRGDFRLDADFNMPASGITAVWGASGSGKTSLLRAIAGLDRIAGTVRIEDTTWQDAAVFIPPHKRRVGYVFQEASLFPHLNVHDNLSYAAKRAPPPADFDAIVADLGIRPLLSRSIHDLSGGERQRVALARVLLSSPRLLLMDEPLSSLDRPARGGILPLIKTLGERLPILYVTHDPSEVAVLADRALRIEAGRVYQGDLPAAPDLTGLSREEIDRLALAAIRLNLQPE